MLQSFNILITSSSDLYNYFDNSNRIIFKCVYLAKFLNTIPKKFFPYNYFLCSEFICIIQAIQNSFSVYLIPNILTKFFPNHSQHLLNLQ